MALPQLSIYVANPPKSKKGKKKKAERKQRVKAKTKHTKKHTARRTRGATSSGGRNMAGKKKGHKKSAKRKKAKSGSLRWYTNPPKKGGGESRGFGGMLGKFVPPSPVALAFGGLTGIASCAFLPNLALQFLPSQTAQTLRNGTPGTIYRVGSCLGLGAGGYFATRRINRSFAIGHVATCAGAAAFELASPFLGEVFDKISDWINGRTTSGAGAMSGGGQSNALPGENGNTTIALASQSTRPALAGWNNGGSQFGQRSYAAA